MPAAKLDDAVPDPEPLGRCVATSNAPLGFTDRPPFILLHVPPTFDPGRYRPLLGRLAARFGATLTVATVVEGALPSPRGMCGTAFVLLKDGHVIAEAFGDLSPGELSRLLEHALMPSSSPPQAHAA